ncbi:hypothetical protein [Parahaliea mediterranea]|uniref:hypothetical protein n=1 Tax=Parahaliea mediterranea TaxID=651086 RepID=UPI0019D459DE|nr:hypothetical protein [Parahaliea mediterranea]
MSVDTTEKTTHPPDGPGRGPLIARWIVAGPLVLIASILVMAGMTVWFPEGAAGINHLAFPLLLFPAIWALLFFYALLDARPWRAGAVILALAVANGIPVVSALQTMMQGGAQ